MIKCKIQMDNESDCQKCCFYCEKRNDCEDACSYPEENCEEAVGEETELDVMSSAVPDVLRAITDITVQKKKLEEQEKLMKKKLQEAMEQHGIKSFENEHVKFLYVAPTTRTTFDSALFKKEHPDLADKYSKVSPVSASVRITVK